MTEWHFVRVGVRFIICVVIFALLTTLGVSVEKALGMAILLAGWQVAEAVGDHQGPLAPGRNDDD